jgi:hypothetical protein
MPDLWALFTKPPSRMELAAWGMGSLLPLAIANSYPSSSAQLYFLGYLSIIACLAIANGRVNSSAGIAIKTFLLLFLTNLFPLGLVASALPIDPRWTIPMTSDYMPFPLYGKNPAHGSAVAHLMALMISWALFSGIAVRVLCAASPTQHAWAISRTVFISAVLAALHFYIVPYESGQRRSFKIVPEPLYSETHAMLGIYSLLMFYAAFYLSLFHDLLPNRAEKK